MKGELQERFGDLFLLPLPEPFDAPPGTCRRQRQRQLGRRRVEEGTRGTITALNHLAGYSDSARWPRTVLNSTQDESFRRILGLRA